VQFQIEKKTRKKEATSPWDYFSFDSQVAKWLVEVAGADILARGKDGLRPVHLAAMGGHKDLLDWIVSKGGLSCKELELKAYKQTCQRAISHEMELATAHLEQLCAKQQPSK
jgi:hypothetical protein